MELSVGETEETVFTPAPSAAREPDVSFIMASYNAAPFIRQSIASALTQTGVAVEVVVADDASTDNSAAIIKAFASEDARVVFIQRAANGGPSATRNDAMARARGRWLAILDADDLIAPERARRLIDLATASGADIVADNYERFYADGETGGATMIPRGAEPYAFTVDIASFLRANRAFGSSRFTLGAFKGMYRADFLRAHGVTHREGLDFGEDFLFCLKCLMAGARFVVSSESFYRYRMHPASQSWRLKAAHLHQLRRMIVEEKLGERFGGGSEIGLAARHYVESFERAGRFTSVVDVAKAGHYGSALAAVARNPDLWPLVVRFGSEAALNRIKARFGS